MQTRRRSRRRFLKTAAAAGAAAVAAPYVKTARSAGRLSIGLWDHWVPGANDTMRRILLDWGEANGVEVSVDFITSIGNKLVLTAQAESRAETGHDILSMSFFMTPIFERKLVPLDDVVADIVAEHGPLSPAADYSAHLGGRWIASPAPTGTLLYPAISRLDLYREHAGIDLAAVFPASDTRDPALVDAWTYDAFLAAAAKLHAAGKPFGAAIAPTPDSNQWLGALFAAFGAEAVDAAGDIAIDSDETREVLDYLSRLTQHMPDSVYAWDDASNNRWLISGEGSSIFNPPSAWAVAKRDAPDVARHLWHHDTPRGPKGRFRANTTFFWAIWEFAENIPAAKDLLRHVASLEVVETMVNASQGFDVPLIPSHAAAIDRWSRAEPPAGVLYNYPFRGDEQPMYAGFPAPAGIAAGISTQAILPNLVARVTAGGDSVDDAIGWAGNEIEGVMRR